MIGFRFLDNEYSKSPKDYNHLPDFQFIGVSPLFSDPSVSEEQYRHMMYKFIPDDKILQAEIIKQNHPMFNYHIKIPI